MRLGFGPGHRRERRGEHPTQRENVHLGTVRPPGIGSSTGSGPVEDTAPALGVAEQWAAGWR